MSLPVISYDGTDITVDVIIEGARFVSSSRRGRPGTCKFRIRDDGHTYDPQTGKDLTLDIEGDRAWTGFVSNVRRGFFFSGTTKSPEDVERYFEITGVDLNVLFAKRVLYDKSTPTNGILTAFAPGTADGTIVSAYMTDHLDLSSDGLDDDLVENVGTPSTDAQITGQAGWTWDTFMRFLTRNTGAIYYIDPDGHVVLTDVDTPTSDLVITDNPVAEGEIGCRELEIDFGAEQLRNDALAWGIGQGAVNPVFARETDAASVAAHGLWQTGAFSQVVWRQATVNRIARSYVYGSPQNKRGGKDDAVAAKCAVFVPGIQAGMKVELRSDVFDYNDVLPVREVAITFPTLTSQRYDLVLSHEIDDPFATYEFWFPDFDVDIDIPDIPDIHIPGFDICAEDPGRDNCTETFSRVETAGWGISEFLTEALFTDDFSRGSMGASYSWSIGEPTISSGEVVISGEHSGDIVGVSVTTDSVVEFEVVTPSSGYAYWEVGVGNRIVAVEIDNGGYGFVYIDDGTGFDIGGFFTLGSRFRVKAAIDASDSGASHVKVWSANDPEPQAWTYDQDSTGAMTGSDVSLYLYADTESRLDDLAISSAYLWVSSVGPTSVGLGDGVGLNDFTRYVDLPFLDWPEQDTVEILVRGTFLQGATAEGGTDGRFLQVVVSGEDGLVADAQLHMENGFAVTNFSEIRVGRDPGGGNYSSYQSIGHIGYGSFEMRVIATDSQATVQVGGGSATIATGDNPGKATRLTIIGLCSEASDGAWLRIHEIEVVRGLACSGGTIGGLMGMFGSGTSETFSRTEASSWGISELGGTWEHEGNGAWDVDGTEASGGRTIAGGTPTWPRSRLPGVLTGRLSVPIEILMKQTFSLGATFAAPYLEGFQMFAYWGIFVGTPAYIELILDDGESGFVSEDFDLDFDPEGETFWTRILIENDTISAKVWIDGDSEPGSYTYVSTDPLLDISAELADTDLDDLVIDHDTFLGSGPTTWDEITFVQGLSGGDPCGAADPGEFQDPPSSGPIGEELNEISTPSGEDPTSTWFETNHQYLSGSERVYLNGLFLRPGTDYLRHPVDRWIEILSSVTVDPGDVVSAKYEIYLSTPAPEIL